MIRDESHLPYGRQSLQYRLWRRAEIRRQKPGLENALSNEPDRLADLLEEAAEEILRLKRLAGETLDD
jgi:hypothetical protein